MRVKVGANDPCRYYQVHAGQKPMQVNTVEYNGSVDVIVMNDRVAAVREFWAVRAVLDLLAVRALFGPRRASRANRKPIKRANACMGLQRSGASMLIMRCRTLIVYSFFIL